MFVLGHQISVVLKSGANRDLDNGRDPEYWREEDFDMLTEEDRAYFRETFGTGNSLSGLSKDKLDEIRASEFNWKVHAKLDTAEGEDDEEDVEAEDENPQQDHQEAQVTRIRHAKGTSRYDEPSEEEDYPFFDGGFDKVVTYTGSGEGDFPMMWSESRLYAYHPESKREPMPFYPKNRKNPSSSHIGILFKMAVCIRATTSYVGGRNEVWKTDQDECSTRARNSKNSDKTLWCVY